MEHHLDSPPVEELLCKFPSCTCPVASTEEYCCLECRSMKDNPAEGRSCSCDHVVCSDDYDSPSASS